MSADYKMRIENRRSGLLDQAMPQAHAPPIFRILHAADEIQEPGHARRHARCDVYPPFSDLARWHWWAARTPLLASCTSSQPLGVEVPTFRPDAAAFRDALTKADAWGELHTLLDGPDKSDVASSPAREPALVRSSTPPA